MKSISLDDGWARRAGTIRIGKREREFKCFEKLWVSESLWVKERLWMRETVSEEETLSERESDCDRETVQEKQQTKIVRKRWQDNKKNS